GGQGVERRDILRYIAIASAASTFPGFSKWAFACATTHINEISAATKPPSSAAVYQPLFFSPPLFAMIERLADIIIPSDETPGAKEAGVAEFIDFMVANRVPVSANRDARNTQDAIELGNDAQTRFLAGLDWLNARSKSEFSHQFMECTPEQQTNLLSELAYKSKFKPITESGRAFFQFLRDYVVVGYYTTKIGLETLGYPGLRTVWPSLPACAHPNDPEHVNLPKPAST
ncbi:MAG: gluconate 2-dehydrogenase subunit 3 family protein, partial [Candidatus Acidiferrum sp.]